MQKNSTWIAAAVVVVLALGAFWYLRRDSRPENLVNLIEQFPQAEKRATLPMEMAFKLENVTIDNVTKPAIYATPHSRIIFSQTIPQDAWLETSFAMRPDCWDMPGDGAQFRIGVSDGKIYEELLRQYVNPKRGDRRWFSARFDLSAYEGRQVKLIFNTDPGPPGDGNTENDFSVWAEPRLYSRR